MKNLNPFISIVVPIYNVEKYLDKCLKSLIHQTYTNIEIVLINDGSTDNCPEICDEYARTDKRIKVIHKKNGGLSDARNVGIEKAIGKYILFVDSDDYISLDTCERFQKIINGNLPDIVVGNAKKITDKKMLILKHSLVTNGKMITGQQYLKEELKSGKMYVAACFNLYNRRFLIENNLEFPVGLLHEDEQFTPIAFLKARSVIGTDIIFYHYLIREGSITRHQDITKNAEHVIQICKGLEKIYRKIEDDELRKLLNDNLVNKYLHIFQVARLYRKEYTHLIEEDKTFLIGKAYSIRNKFKVFLFLLNKKIYFYTNELTKIFLQK